MIGLLEIAERCQKGPKMPEKDWDLKLFRHMSDLAKKYGIAYPDDDRWFSEDDDLAERAFRAGVEFLAENGVYCISTGRVLRFSEKEILEAIAEAPDYVLMGEGRDQRCFSQKKIEGREPLNFCPGHHAPFDEEIGPMVVKNFAQIPRTDFIEGFNFPRVDGREIFGLPMEVYATKRQLSWMREGVRKAGRPGLSIVYYPITTRAAVLISTMDPDYGLRRTDGILLSVLPDLKMETDLLGTAIAGQDYGLYSISGSFSMMGGFCGGIEGAIIEGVAKPITAMLCYRDYINYTGVEHISGVSVRQIQFQPVNWGRSVVQQALIHHTNTISMAWIIPTSGPGTETHLYEVALRTIEATINGANLYAPRHSRALMNTGQTPLEGEFMVEISDAVLASGIDRDKANDMLSKLAELLKEREPEPGLPIQECYDLVYHRPKPELEKAYSTVKGKLSSLGLDFS